MKGTQHQRSREAHSGGAKFIRSAALILLLPCVLALADSDAAWTYEPAQSNLEAREWFQDAKFGIFIHWGVYSELGGAGEEGIAEWVMERKKIPIDKHGLKLFFYYSQLDWHHPDYYPRGMTGNVYTGRPESGDWDRYIEYMNAQLTELLTNYGDIGGIWFDGWWDQKDTPMRDRWRLKETYELIHRLQPQALIISNHHVTPFPGEDAQPFEQDLPGENTAGFNTSHISRLPLEMAQTMNGSWGFNLIDDNFKSTDELIRTLVSAAGRNSNFLMNTGPMPNGKLQPENVQTYKEIGEWMSKFGESIYGTRGGPVSPRPWGVTTQKDGTVYVHILDWNEGVLPLPLEADIGKATLLQDGRDVAFERSDGGYLLKLPKLEPNGPVTVIRLELD